jgi:hypothetical protein
MGNPLFPNTPAVKTAAGPDWAVVVDHWMKRFLCEIVGAQTAVLVVTPETCALNVMKMGHGDSERQADDKCYTK